LLVALAVVVLVLAAGGILAATRPWAHPVATNTPTPGAPANVFPTETSGTWVGTYQQSDGRAYQIELAITGGTDTAQVRYPDLGCLGTVTVLSRTGTSIRAQERISSGRCTLTGIMTIQLQPTGQHAVTTTRPLLRIRLTFPAPASDTTNISSPRTACHTAVATGVPSRRNVVRLTYLLPPSSAGMVIDPAYGATGRGGRDDRGARSARRRLRTRSTTLRTMAAATIATVTFTAVDSADP